MADEFKPPIRFISILVAIVIAAVLSYAYHVVLPSFPMVTTIPPDRIYFEMGVASLITFITIPMLTGFTTGLIHPKRAVANGLYVGLLSGVVNSIIASIKILFKPYLTWDEIYVFAFFVIISIFLWMIATAASTLLAKALIQELSGKSNNPNTSKRKNNPEKVKNPDSPDCSHYSKLLDALANNNAIPDVCLTCVKATDCLQGRE